MRAEENAWYSQRDGRLVSGKFATTNRVDKKIVCVGGNGFYLLRMLVQCGEDIFMLHSFVN